MMKNMLPYCQIYDLDGTLAIMGNRGPYEWDKVGEDLINPTVFWANGDITFEDVKGFKTETYKVKKKIVENFYPINIKEI